MPLDFDDDQPSFSEFITSSDASEPQEPASDQPEANQPADPQPEPEQTPVADPPVEPAVQESQEDLQEPVAPSAEERLTFEGYLRQQNFEIDEDVDPEDLYARAASEIQSAAASREEIARLKEELAKAQQAPSQPAPSAAPAPAAAPVDTQPESPEPQSGLFQELKEYDPSLRSFVEIDEKGRALPKTEFGPAAIEAANTINAYEQAAARQASLLMKNPNALIQENMSVIERLAEEKAKALIDERFSSYEAEQDKRLEEQRQQSAQAEYDKQLEQWHESNKGKVFKLGPDGDPRVDPFDANKYAFTPLGKTFQSELLSLQQRLPGVGQLELLQLAMERAELQVPQQPAQPQQPQTPLQQKQQFVEQRQTPVPNQNSQPAPIEDVAEAFPNMRFSDMVRRDPDNADVIASWQ